MRRHLLRFQEREQAHHGHAFDGPALAAILTKTREPGGAELTGAEWASLEATEARAATHLEGTEDWFEECYTWRGMTMSSEIRSTSPVRKAKAVLCIVQTEDDVVSPWPELRRGEVRNSVV